jgi:hypothetical protein
MTASMQATPSSRATTNSSLSAAMSKFRTSSADSRKDGVVNPKHDAISPHNGVDVQGYDFAARRCVSISPGDDDIASIDASVLSCGSITPQRASGVGSRDQRRPSDIGRINCSLQICTA